MQQIDIRRAIVIFHFKEEYKTKEYDRITTKGIGSPQRIIDQKIRQGYIEVEGKYFLMHQIDRIRTIEHAWYVEEGGN